MYNRNYSSLMTSKELFKDPLPPSANLSVVQALRPPCPESDLLGYQIELIPAIYGVIFTVGYIGNCVVVTVLCLHNGPKSVAYFYIFNLAVADLLFLSTLPLWATYYASGFEWLFGSVMCKISGSLLCLNLFASIFFITCMSVDRYLAIVYPLRSQRRTLHQACVVAALVWGFAILASLPTFYFRELQYIENLRVNACVLAYPPEQYSIWCAGFALVKNVLGFCVPIMVIVTCYVGIGRHLMKHQRPGKIKQNRDKVLGIFAAVVIAFLMCWLPFHILTFLDALIRLKIIKDCQVISAVNAAMPYCLCLGFANSSINPLLYCFVGNQFKEKFNDIFQLKPHQLLNSHPNSSSRKGSEPREVGPTVNCEIATSNPTHIYCIRMNSRYS